MDDSRKDWVAAFQARHGRKPRVLHIGNIANNAYLNAKLLNQSGFDCDVLCYDYYHIMGCPEWEEADITGDIGDPFHPNWLELNINGYKRPEWFSQGPLRLSCHYLIAKRSGNARMAHQLWKILSEYNHLNEVEEDTSFISVKNFLTRIHRLTVALKGCLINVLHPIWNLLKRWEGGSGGCLIFWPRRACLLLMRILRVMLRFSVVLICNPGMGLEHCRDIFSGGYHSIGNKRIKQFHARFPDRVDSITATDLFPYMLYMPMWKRLFSYYDIVQGYATDGIWPLVAGKHPYTAFEHGTIRNIPFEATVQGRCCAMSYGLADAVFITNCDNILAAQKLELTNYRFIPHPVNESEAITQTETVEELRRFLEEKLNSNMIVFHPSRQHWDEKHHPDWEKGNDIFLKGFARFVKEVHPRAAAVLVDWGQKVEESRSLIQELGVADRVLWIPPQTNQRMLRYLKACDCLADQFYLGAFGSTVPKGLMCGKPVLVYLNEEVHRWAFPEMPPVLNTKMEADVFEALKKLFSDPEFRAETEKKSIKWYRKYHSNQVIAQVFHEVYEDLITKTY